MTVNIETKPLVQGKDLNNKQKDTFKRLNKSLILVRGTQEVTDLI